MAAPHTDSHAATSGADMLFNLQFLHDQLFWTGAAFLLLFAVLVLRVLPMLTKALDERANKIADDLNTAESSRHQAEKLLADYESKLALAKDEAAGIISAARVDAKQIVDQRLAELEQELAKKRQETEAAMKATREQALQDLQGDVAKLVVDATQQLVQTKVSNKDAEELTTKAIKSLVH